MKFNFIWYYMRGPPKVITLSIIPSSLYISMLDCIYGLCYGCEMGYCHESLWAGEMENSQETYYNNS